MLLHKTCHTMAAFYFIYLIYRKDLEEEQACRRALQKREVPNYFDSEWGKSFLLSLSAGPDMDALTKNLAVETRKGEGEGNNHSLPSTPAETPISARNGMSQYVKMYPKHAFTSCFSKLK